MICWIIPKSFGSVHLWGWPSLLGESEVLMLVSMPRVLNNHIPFEDMILVDSAACACCLKLSKDFWIWIISCCCSICSCCSYSRRFLWLLYPLAEDAEELVLVGWATCACWILQDIWACGIICFNNGCKWLPCTTICLEVIVWNVSLDSELVLSFVLVSDL